MAIRILHVITKLELGGAQKNVLNILSHLDSKKFKVFLISSSGMLKQEACSIRGLNLTLTPLLTRLPNPIFDIFCFLFLVIFMRKHKIQVVHTHSSKAGIIGRWAARLAGVPVVIHTVHGWGFHDYSKSIIYDFYIFLEKKTAKITNKIVVVSEHDRQKGLENGIGSLDQYKLVRSGINMPGLKEPGYYLAKRHSLGLTENDKIVAMVACFKPQKNPLDFIICAQSVLEEDSGVKFILIGDGSLRFRLEKEIAKRKLEDSIYLLGWRKDVEDILPVVDVLVLTSLWEGLPLVFLEAMHFAKPIVAYDVCGVNEVVKDGVNGFLVQPGDIQELSDKIKLVLGNEALKLRMGEFGRHFAQEEVNQHSFMIRQMERLYEEEFNRFASKGVR